MVRRAKVVTQLLLRIDRSSDSSLQSQIREGLREAVRSGRLAAGARLPSSRVLASDLGVSRATVVAALMDLLKEGILTPQPRSGITVASGLHSVALAGSILPAVAEARIRSSKRMEALAESAREAEARFPRPRAFRLSRPALDQFPVKSWSRIVSKLAARISYQQLDYGPESGLLRSAVAEHVSSSRGMKVHADQVLVCSGGQRALELAVQATLDPGDGAWMEQPGYPGAFHLLRAAGAVVSPIPVDSQGLLVVEGEATAGDARLAMTTPACQFPLGVTMSVERREALLRWADRANACIVENDDNADFRYEGPPQPALQAIPGSGRVLLVSSFSRTMFPALRLGVLIAPPAFANRLRALRASLEDQLPSLDQLALAEFILDGHYARHLRRMKILYRARRDALFQAVSSFASDCMTLRPVDSGLQAIADLSSHVDAESVAAAASARGLEVTPLSRFYFDRRPCPSIVLGFGGIDPDRIHLAVQELATATREVAGSVLQRPTRPSGNRSVR